LVFAVTEQLYDELGKPRYGREYDLEDACKRLDISVKTYKAWEKKGFIPEVRRSSITGYRVLLDEDIIRLRKFVERRKREPKSRLGINKKGTDKRRHWNTEDDQP
jgi:DNA-binding transcriptional MerR regulator